MQKNSVFQAASLRDLLLKRKTKETYCFTIVSQNNEVTEASPMYCPYNLHGRRIVHSVAHSIKALSRAASSMFCHGSIRGQSIFFFRSISLFQKSKQLNIKTILLKEAV